MKPWQSPTAGHATERFCVNSKADALIEHQLPIPALEGSSGQEKWSWQPPVEFNCGKAGFDAAYQRSKWQPWVLERRGQPSLVAVGFWGWQQPARLVVLDHTGKLVGERAVSSRAWPESTNADLQLLEVAPAGDAVPPLASWLDRYPSSIPTSRCRLPPWMWGRADLHRLHHGRGLDEGGTGHLSFAVRHGAQDPPRTVCRLHAQSAFRMDDAGRSRVDEL